MMKVLWRTGDISWVSLESLKLHDPYSLLLYAGNQPHLQGDPEWKWMDLYLQDNDTFNDVRKALRTQSQSVPKYKFGGEVPRSVRHVYVILRDRITRRGITWEAGAKVLQYTEHIERVPDTDATHPDITSVSTTSASVSPVYTDVIDILPSSSSDNMDDLLARMAYLQIQQQPGSFEDNCCCHLSLIAQHHQRAHD